VPDITQTRKKEGRNLTHKERFPAFIRGTVQTHVADTFIKMTVAGRMRTGHVQENLTPLTSRALHFSPISLLHGNISDTTLVCALLWHTVISYVARLIRCVAPGERLKDCGAVVTGQLDNMEKGRILLGRTQQGVIATNCMDGRWREVHPTLASLTEQPLLPTTIVEGHRTSLSVHV
jgi:hypothetical protein